MISELSNMIRTTILLFVIVFAANAQDVYVIQQVKGKVIRNGQSLKKADKVKSNDKLTFGEGSALLVSSQKIGRLVLQQAKGTFASETSYTFGDLLPQKKNASTRGVLCSAVEFRQLFKDSVFRVYGKPMFRVCSSGFTVDSSRFFYVQYQLNGKPVNKPLQNKGDVITVDPASIYAVDGKPVDRKSAGRLSLFYYDPQSRRNEKLARLAVEFIDIPESTKKELASMVSMFEPGTSCYADVYNSINHHLEKLYGQAPLTNLDEWLDAELGVNKTRFPSCK